jgi:hypothetical protein
MKQRSITTLIALVAGLAFAGNALATVTHRCGGGHYFGYSNLRERNTTCTMAHKVAKAEWFNPHGIGSKWFYGFHCTGLTTESGNVFTCKRGGAGIWFEELPLAGSAQAAPIRECGSRNAANGYQSIVNITSRNVSCPQARHIAFVIYREVGPDSEGYARCPHNCIVRWAGWRIAVRWHATPPVAGQAADVRATASRGRVVHFQAYGE